MTARLLLHELLDARLTFEYASARDQFTELVPDDSLERIHAIDHAPLAATATGGVWWDVSTAEYGVRQALKIQEIARVPHRPQMSGAEREGIGRILKSIQVGTDRLREIALAAGELPGGDTPDASA